MMIWLVLFFPLLGAFLNGFFLPKHNRNLSHFIGVSVMLASFACSVNLFSSLLDHEGSSTVYLGYSWIKAGSLDIPFELILDRLSGLMLMIVTGIGSLIHIYAGAYMHEEKTVSRFFSYLNLFVFMMLLLVLGNNFLVMFVGWEGVGLCSYLLIGYWFEHKPNAVAGMKAFVVNRIGDFGFLLGIFITYKTFHTLTFSELSRILLTGELSQDQIQNIFYITLCLFVGACGKSAQIPLYVWLPDAMAGPTPVSALIHAATMVTAGIYMMTRLNTLFYFAPTTMMIVAIVGASTALFAATIALVQNDIKKVLAYSTVSQLGFMVLACGVGAFEAGVFHLLTHACFKALLFLGAGSVIVAMHHKQDIWEMGGLSKYLPITHKVFLIGVLAIIGFPGFSGFFSKDEILWRAFVFPEIGIALWTTATLAAICTSFYMVRLLSLTFYGQNRSDEHTKKHLHETPAIMWFPLCVLALLSFFIGYLGMPEFLAESFGLKNYFSHYLKQNILVPENVEFWKFLHEHHSVALEWLMMSLATFLGLCSACLAYFLYKNGPSQFLNSFRNSHAKTHKLLLNKYLVDELYAKYVVQPLHDTASFLWKIVDIHFINGFINSFSRMFMSVSGLISLQDTGSIQRYTALFIFGLLGLIFLVFR